MAPEGVTEAMADCNREACKYLHLNENFILVAVRAQTTGQNPCRVTFVCLTYTFC